MQLFGVYGGVILKYMEKTAGYTTRDDTISKMQALMQWLFVSRVENAAGPLHTRLFERMGGASIFIITASNE